MNNIELPTAASFLITEDCNLECKYCFELGMRNKKTMTKEVAKKAVEYLCNNSLINGNRHFNIMFFGGEPFIKPDIVRYCIEHALDLSKRTKTSFSCSVVTNATILNEEVKSLIRDYRDKANMSIQLSIDGIKKSHDMYRVDRSGKGTFDRIEKLIPEWKELFKDKPNFLNIHGCLNKHTLKYLFESYKYFREEWDVPRLWFMPIHSEEWNKDDFILYEKELDKIADYIIERAKKENSIVEVDNYAPIDRCLRSDRRPDKPCGAGVNFVTITATGKISPCHQFYFNDPEGHTLIGDIWDGIDDEKRRIYLEYDYKDLSCHREKPDCDAFHCYRCIADNYVQKGSMLSQIRGERCKMSLSERKVQSKVKNSLLKAGILKKGTQASNPGCKCQLRGN